MAPGQRTFTIVPNPLGIQGLQQRPAGESVPTNHRPMTSKQAQKLHRQATKVPKMTRAEERAWEKKMQADIKEEKEKHRQSNKARMLRNKKKEREQKIIEAKKRKGLPIVDVRPSQDLITRFVKGNGTAKKRDSAGAGLDTVREESPACDSATETAADADTHGLEEEEVEDSDAKSEYLAQVPEPRQSPAKRQRTESPEARHSAGSPVASPRHFPRASTALSALRVLDHKSRESSMDVDDTAIEDMLTTQILEESISAANSSAVQQRSPVRSNGITSNQQVSQGKENTPPLSKTTITSECCVKKSPRRLAQARLSPQRNSPKADSVTSRKRPAGRSPAPSEAVKRPGLSESQISPKPPNAPHPGPKNPHQAAAAASNNLS
ncbi:hypothetical protein GE09DRAFT_1295178 [Coniochaeta sp. 2T2.1]|nr:hypothetical protein GE09DRAFT_1295178 [Coniochaeta sp. 2T2.1]